METGGRDYCYECFPWEGEWDSMEPPVWEWQTLAKRRSKPPPCVFKSILGSSTVSKDSTVHSHLKLLAEEKMPYLRNITWKNWSQNILSPNLSNVPKLLLEILNGIHDSVSLLCFFGRSPTLDDGGRVKNRHITMEKNLLPLITLNLAIFTSQRYKYKFCCFRTTPSTTSVLGSILEHVILSNLY